MAITFPDQRCSIGIAQHGDGPGAAGTADGIDYSGCIQIHNPNAVAFTDFNESQFFQWMTSYLL